MNLRSFLGPCALAKRCHRPLGQFSVIWSPHLDSNQAKSLCRRRPRHSAIWTCLADRLGLEPRTTILEIVMLPITPPTYKCCDSGDRTQHERLMRPSCPPVHLIAICGSTFLSMKLAAEVGFKPTTLGFKVRCSNQLSYSASKWRNE